MSNPAEEARRILTHSSSVLPYALGIALVKHAEELRRLRQTDVETFMQQVATAEESAAQLDMVLRAEITRSNRLEAELTDSTRFHLARIAALERTNRRMQWWLWGLSIACDIVTLSALWSAYAS